MLTQKMHDKFGYLIVSIIAIIIIVLSVLYFIYNKPKKSQDFHMYQYNVEPACIHHIQYYIIGDTDGLKAITPVFTKEGKTVECNF